MTKSNIKRVTFRVLSGGGGMVQGMTNGEFYRMVHWWKNEYGDYFNISQDGLLRHCDFSDKEQFQLFLNTFKPQREHWWKNATIQSGESES